MELKIIPKISEKSYAQATDGTYIFTVPDTATKQAVAHAIAKQYKVKVVNVNIAISKGKIKQSYRKGGGSITGRRSDIKKAYVRLAEGDKIALFEEEAK